MILPIDVKNAVGLLHVREGRAGVPIGTCFYVTVAAGQHVFSYIVTNKHVVDGPLELGQDIYLRANRPELLGVDDFQLSSGWFYHSDPAVDLAVSPQLGIPGAFPASATAIHSDSIVTRQHLSGPLREGSEVCYLGLLGQEGAQPRNYPLVRQGQLALNSAEPIEGYYGPANYYLVECASYPGNSGSPLFMPAETSDGRPSLALLGVLAARGDKFLSNLDAGIALVTPSEYILDILRQVELVELRQQGLGAGRVIRDQPGIRAN